MPPGRPELVAGAIRDAYEGRFDLDEMGRRGRAYVEREADREVALARYREVLAELVSFEQRAVEPVDVVDEARDRVAAEHSLLPDVARRAPSAGSAAISARRSAIASVSPTSTRKPSTPSRDDVRDAADVGRHDRPSGGERLDDRHRRALVRRRQHDGVGNRVPARRRPSGSRGRARGAATPRSLCAQLEALAIAAVADEQEAGVDAALA